MHNIIGVKLIYISGTEKWEVCLNLAFIRQIEINDEMIMNIDTGVREFLLFMYRDFHTFFER